MEIGNMLLLSTLLFYGVSHKANTVNQTKGNAFVEVCMNCASKPVCILPYWHLTSCSYKWVARREES
jgi:hypothetical protein